MAEEPEQPPGRRSTISVPIVIGVVAALIVAVALGLAYLRRTLTEVDPRVPFTTAASDSWADAQHLNQVLRGTAAAAGVDTRRWFARSGSQGPCALPDGGTGTYYSLDAVRHTGPVDYAAVVAKAEEYWRSLGYTVADPPAAPTTIASPLWPNSGGASTPSGGRVEIFSGPDSTYLSGTAGCSSVDSGPTYATGPDGWGGTDAWQSAGLTNELLQDMVDDTTLGFQVQNEGLVSQTCARPDGQRGVQYSARTLTLAPASAAGSGDALRVVTRYWTMQGYLVDSQSSTAGAASARVMLPDDAVVTITTRTEDGALVVSGLGACALVDSGPGK
jgi:hypothetical protein